VVSCASLRVPIRSNRDKSFCSSIPDNKNFHTPSIESDSPFLYCLLSQPDNKVTLDASSTRGTHSIISASLVPPRDAFRHDAPTKQRASVLVEGRFGRLRFGLEHSRNLARSTPRNPEPEAPATGADDGDLDDEPDRSLGQHGARSCGDSGSNGRSRGAMLVAPVTTRGRTDFSCCSDQTDGEHLFAFAVSVGRGEGGRHHHHRVGDADCHVAVAARTPPGLFKSVEKLGFG
jgi:hypothetical protein